jgi:outer membrane protein assembly factor BamB
MKFVFLATFFLTGCFFGPVQELHDQIEETYFGSEFKEPPTPLNDLESSINLEVIWQENIGEHNGDNLDIFHMDDFLYVATSDGTIKKLDSNSGNKFWEKKFNVTVTSGIAGDGENLFFSTADGFLWCMDHDGELIWKTLLSGAINSLPITYNSKVVVKLNSYKIVQLNSKDGSVIWKYQAAIPPLTFKSDGRLVQANNVVYLGLPGGKLIAIDSPTGGLVWESNISRAKGVTDIERANDITSHPVIDDAFIYGVTTNGDIAALDRRSGKSIWTEPISSFYGMAFDGMNLFITHDTGSIYSVNKIDGEIEWRQSGLKHRRIRVGTIIKDYIAFGDYDGYVHFLRIDDGSIVGRIKLEDSQILNNIIKIDDSVIVVMTADGDLICLEVGEETIINQPGIEGSEDSIINNDPINKEIKVDSPSKHRIFNKEESKQAESLDEEGVEKEPNNLKKHRVFDKKNKEKGILDWLF